MKDLMQKYFSNFGDISVLVVGDVMLDEYIHGSVHRVSPEAPVPVLLEEDRSYSLGGAGNVAKNIQALGGRVGISSVIGGDLEGEKIIKLCEEHGIKNHLIKDDSRHTTLKVRSVSGGHQLLRIDREHNHPSEKTVIEKILNILEREASEYDFVVISDYAKGFITSEVLEKLFSIYGGAKISADLKPINAEVAKDLRFIKPNLKEAYEMVGVNTSSNEGLDVISKKLHDKYRTSSVITRGPEGISGFDHVNDEHFHFPANEVHVYDVTGAGDTVMAALSLMVASGSTLKDAANAANYIGGLAVSKRGTSHISFDEVFDSIS